MHKTRFKKAYKMQRCSTFLIKIARRLKELQKVQIGFKRFEKLQRRFKKLEQDFKRFDEA
jgi:hypothetical protein